jgi:hypothetical protein
VATHSFRVDISLNLKLAPFMPDRQTLSVARRPGPVGVYDAVIIGAGTNLPIKPRVFMLHAGSMARYRDKCADIARNNYEEAAFEIHIDACGG